MASAPGLDQQESGDVAGRGAERATHRKLMRPRRHAQEDQAANIDARQHEQQRHRRREHLEDGPHIPEHGLRKRPDPGSSHHLPLAGVLLPVHLPHGREELGPRRPGRGSRSEAGYDVKPTAIHQGAPILSADGIGESGGRDTHDRVAPPCKRLRQLAPEHTGVASEAPLPGVVAQHQHRGLGEGFLFRPKQPAERRASAEYVEEVSRDPRRPDHERAIAVQ